MPSRQRAEGINWGLVVGGAAATVLSLAFSQRRRRKYTPSQQDQHAVSAVDVEIMALPSSCGDQVSNRDAVHKLRNQLRSRDEMIMEMQNQLADREKAVHSHKSLIRNLETQLKEANESIFEVEQVIQDIRERASTPAADIGRAEVGIQCSVELGNQPTAESSMVLHAKEGGYDLVFEKAKHLEAELLGIRAMAQEMASLLDISERERLRLHHVVSQLQQKLAFQAKELNMMRATTQFLKMSLSNRKSENESDLYNDLRKDFEASILDATATRGLAEPRYAEAAEDSPEKMEIAEMDPSVKEDNSTSSSDPEFTEIREWGGGESLGRRRITDYERDDSPGVVRIGSPTIVGSGSVDGLAARRYLFEAEEEDNTASGFSSVEVVVEGEHEEREEEEEEEEEAARSSSSSLVMDEMLDDTLDDLLKATTPTRASKS